MYECRNGKEQGRRLFVDLFAWRRVRRLGRAPVSSYQPSTLSPISSVRNDPLWYVVSSGPQPGVYEGRPVTFLSYTYMFVLMTVYF